MAGSFGWDFILRGPHGQERVIQFDWDYPRYAADFGWSPSLVNPESGCPHENTDGTVPCRKCGIAISDFLSRACDHLIAHIGRSIPDPGYFAGDECSGLLVRPY